MTTRCSIDSDQGRDPQPNPNGRPSLGASASAGHGNPVAHTRTDSWHTASTIDDQPYTVRGAPAARQRRQVMNPRLERHLDLVKCAKSVCLSNISRITHVPDTGRPERDDILVAAVDGGSALRRPSRRCGGYAVVRVPCSLPAGYTLMRSRTGEQPSGSTLILTGRIGGGGAAPADSSRQRHNSPRRSRMRGTPRRSRRSSGSRSSSCG
jgi:hypothetical protein